MAALLETVSQQLGGRYLQLAASTTAQQLLEDFFTNTVGANELQRIESAKKLYSQWQQAYLPESWFPAVPSRSDWWYLIQLFSRQLHISDLGVPIHFSVSRSYEILVEDRNDSSLWQLLQQAWVRTDMESEIGAPSSLSRREIDAVLSQVGSVVLDTLGLSPTIYGLRLIHFDELVRLAKELHISENEMVHVSGYRKRLSGELDGLIAGNHEFGGFQHIDSWWQNIPLTRARTCLIISQRL